MLTKISDKLLIINNIEVLQHFVNVFSCLNKVFWLFQNYDKTRLFLLKIQNLKYSDCVDTVTCILIL